MPRYVTYLLILAVLWQPAGTSAADGSRWEFKDVARIVVIGDVHGSYDKLVQLLDGTGLVNADLSWIGGTDHLVLCGDLVDRGPDDRAVLDIVRRLQSEASETGGRVHVLLGNHEVMNLAGDLRYVSKEAFSAFREDETGTDRNRAFGYWDRLHHHRTNRNEFNRAYPFGYFGRTRAFSLEGEYGEWLVGLPAVIKVNDILFVHGGITDQVAELGLDGINQQVRESLERLAAEDNTYANMAGREREDDSLPFALDGPLWYRGYSLENERLLRSSTERALELLDAKRMVVAHTPTASGDITSRLNAQILRVDVGMTYDREAQALVFQGEDIRVFNPGATELSSPVREAPQGEQWSEVYSELPDKDLEQFLRRATVSGRETIVAADGREFEILELERRKNRLRAIFNTNQEQSPAGDPTEPVPAYRHDVAAYRLDRMLGLNMVPVSILRTVDGVEGSLEIWLEGAIDLRYIRQNGAWEQLHGLGTQIGEIRLFNALIDTANQPDEAQMLLPLEQRLMSSGNDKSFTLAREVDLTLPSIEGAEDAPADVQEELSYSACNALDSSGTTILTGLNRDKLKQELGDYLDEEQLDALLARRNSLLESCRVSQQPAG